jgi:hypothetical protein
MRKLERLQVKRLSWIVALISTCVATATLAQDADPCRCVVKVFKYASDQPESVDQPDDMIGIRIGTMAESVFSANPSLSALANLKVIGVKDPYPSTIRDRAQFWNTAKEVLVFLNGELHYHQNPPKIVSNVYLGGDKGILVNPMITIQTEVTWEGNLGYDLHCAVTLYALAMDASRLNSDNGVVSQYLAEALTRLKFKTASSSSTLEEMRNTLINIINNQLTTLASGPKGP